MKKKAWYRMYPAEFEYNKGNVLGEKRRGLALSRAVEPMEDIGYIPKDAWITSDDVVKHFQQKKYFPKRRKVWHHLRIL